MRPHFLADIPSGLDGTRVTLAVMRDFARLGKLNPDIRELALSLTRGLRQKDFLGEVKRVFEFVRDRIRYVRDIHGVETLQLPEVTLEIGQGDCDDKAVLLAAMLETLGHPARFKAVGFRPRHCSHVYVETRVNGMGPWIALDPTNPVPMGWQPPNPAHVIITPV